jgi:hypothetical protein
LVNDVVGRYHELHVLVLNLLIFSQSDAGGEVDIAIEVDDVNCEVSDVSDLVVVRKIDLILHIGDSFLNES